MRTIRTRLTAAYSAALVATVVLFAVVLWLTRRNHSYDELQRVVRSEADLVLGVILQTERSGLTVTVGSDTTVGAVTSARMRAMLQGVRGYIVVLAQDSGYLYRSEPVMRLDADEQAHLAGVGAGLSKDTGAVLSVGNERLLIVARTPSEPSAVARVIVGVSTRTADLAVRELIVTMLIVAPLLLLTSIAAAYFLVGRAFRPVDRIIDEMHAITDGRSLHRRLQVDDSIDEIGRLSLTLNEMMERLEKSFGALRRFTADASHELKTPLTVLRADVERAMNPAIPAAERLEALEEALQETTRMADLVDSLLTLARADEGRFDLHREPVELEPLVRDVYETAVILGEDAGLTVTLSAIEPGTVLGDLTRLRQLLLNLVVNAIKYTPRGGSVEVALSVVDRTATVTVRDTGIGIVAADLPHVFERFYRADRVRSRRVAAADSPGMLERGGFGLGLAISRWIAEAHGGTISVRSRYGRGSTFTVTLPLAELPSGSADAALPETARAS